MSCGIQKHHKLGGLNRVKFTAKDSEGNLVDIDGGTLAIGNYFLDGVDTLPVVGTVAQVVDAGSAPITGCYELTFPSTGLTTDSDVFHMITGDIGGTPVQIGIDSTFYTMPEALPSLCG